VAIVGLVVAACLVVFAVSFDSWAELLRGAGLMTPFLVVAWVDGPTCAVGVTPTRVVISNSFIRYAVPRALAVEFVVVHDLGVRLRTTLGEEIKVRAAEPPVSPATSGSGRRYQAACRSMNDLLAEVPADRGPAGAIEQRPRRGNMTLVIAVALVCGAVALSIYI
jgi:hypothetical protein